MPSERRGLRLCVGAGRGNMVGIAACAVTQKLHTAGKIRIARHDEYGCAFADIDAVAVGAVADEFGVNFRTAPFGVFQFFQYENPRAFSPMTSPSRFASYGRGGLFRFAVAAAGGIERVENIHFGRAKFFAAARQHHIGQTVFDGLVSITYALAARRTRARCRDDASLLIRKRCRYWRRRCAASYAHRYWRRSCATCRSATIRPHLRCLWCRRRKSRRQRPSVRR